MLKFSIRHGGMCAAGPPSSSLLRSCQVLGDLHSVGIQFWAGLKVAQGCLKVWPDHATFAYTVGDMAC